MPPEPYRAPKRPNIARTSDPLDLAARFLVYKLYDVTAGKRLEQHLVRTLGERHDAVLRSVELGWTTLHEAQDRKPQKRAVALTEEGRRVARRER